MASTEKDVYKLMQPSKGTLNSPRVVKDSTPSRRRILRCISLRIGESSPNLIFAAVNLDPIVLGKSELIVNLDRTILLKRWTKVMIWGG